MDIGIKLQEKAQEILSLLMRISNFYRECKYLNTTRDSREQFFINHNEMLTYSRFSILFVMVLDLCKLYNEKEAYSIQRFLRENLNNYEELPWRNSTTKNDIEKWLNDFDNVELCSIVAKIIALRDKHYAHLDYQRPNINGLIPSFIELEKIIDHAVVTMQSFYSFAFGTSLIVTLPIEAASKELLGKLKELDDLYRKREP